MTQICKGVCEWEKASAIPNYLRYVLGQKRCGLCNCYFNTKEIICPCCSTRLRTKPRSKKNWEQ